MMGFLDNFKFSRLREGLSKTRDALITKVSRLIFAKGKIDSEFLEQLEEILLSSDVGVDTSHMILTRIQNRTKEQRYETTEELDMLVKEEIKNVLQTQVKDDRTVPFSIPASKKPYVIMIVGVNGVGKTTTIGKLAYNYKNANKVVVIGAADTFRAAANEQLEIWAKRAGVPIVSQAHGSDPAAVAFDTVRSAQAKDADVVIIDTAGRLHTKTNLMEELKKIKRVMDKCLSGAPHEIYLVLDATTGQNAKQQAKQFHDAVGLTGLIVTKLDGTAKGGVVFSISQSMKLPVRFIGVGEKIDDLQPFDAEQFVQALFEKTD